MMNDTLACPTIGSRIKEKRNSEGISIRELAGRSQLTASFISQVENGKTNVSLDSLRRISEALKVPMLYFLSDQEPQPEKIEGAEEPAPVSDQENAYQLFDRTSPFIKKNMRAKLFFPDNGITYEMLTSRLDHKMEAFMGQMAPGTGNIAANLNTPTEEFIFCLSGALRVGIGDQFYLVEAGDAIYFEGKDLTCIASGSKTELTTWLSVITPPAF